MPEEIAGELLRPVFRLIAYIVVEIVFELAIKGLGYLLCRPFSRDLDPDGIMVTVVGLLAWGVLISLGVFLWLR
ncbi:hypothetical protein [Hydrogenophaga sp. 5NK40-0174]|uniref:hypothetical protein n=1 Tax=Hydrogenophaga sp. 5NK40-0174 TaxID=3127649 RepID=UPI00310BEB86